MPDPNTRHRAGHELDLALDISQTLRWTYEPDTALDTSQTPH
jgi:hypothetical protein